MRQCCPKCGLKSLKSKKVRRTRRIVTPEGIISEPYGPVVLVYTCRCGWMGRWSQLAKRPSKKSEKRARQIEKRYKRRGAMDFEG